MRRKAHYEIDCPTCGDRVIEDRDPEYAPLVATVSHCGRPISVGRTLYQPDGTAIHNP